MDNLYALTQSRFKDEAIVIDEGIERFMNRERLDVVARTDDVLYTVRDDDRIDRLAYRYLGDARHWWVIADYNNLLFPLMLTVGDILRIPSIPTLQMFILR